MKAARDTASGKCWFEAQAVDYAYTLYNGGDAVESVYLTGKEKMRIEVGKNYNLPKNEDSRQPQCPEDKESAIVEALKHFKMIQKN